MNDHDSTQIAEAADSLRRLADGLESEWTRRERRERWKRCFLPTERPDFPSLDFLPEDQVATERARLEYVHQQIQQARRDDALLMWKNAVAAGNIILNALDTGAFDYDGFVSGVLKYQRGNRRSDRMRNSIFLKLAQGWLPSRRKLTTSNPNHPVYTYVEWMRSIADELDKECSAGFDEAKACLRSEARRLKKILAKIARWRW